MNSTGTLSKNLIRNNSAGLAGGGLYVYQGSPYLIGNSIISNTTVDVGGGVYADYSSAILYSNTVSSSTANRGGGLWLTGGDATLDSNIIASNTATESGGGLYLWLGANTMINNVIADNHIQYYNGSGMYLEGSSSQLWHNTIARNFGGEGSGIYVTDSWGNPSQVGMTNTLVISHAIGINITSISTATVNGVLWFGNGSNVNGGGTITITSAYSGTPAFAGDGYHLALGSAAIDKGVDVGVTTDIDGQSRPYGAAPDLGADEYLPGQNLALSISGRERLIGQQTDLLSLAMRCMSRDIFLMAMTRCTS